MPANIRESSGFDQQERGQSFEMNQFARKYSELEQIGEGGAAVVKKCKNKVTEKVYACKIMRNYDEEKERTSRAEFELIYYKKDHPNVINATEFISTIDRTYTIMELAPGVEL
jgi:serine/threonine protein kinase